MADVQIAVIDQQNTQIALAAPAETQVNVAVPGVQGPAGEGVPSGGTANQVLFKQSGTDYDTAWSEITSEMIGDLEIVNADIAADAEIAVSKLADGAARQLLQTDAAGTGVEWTSNVDIPGTLDVAGAATFDSSVAVTGTATAAALIPSGSSVPTNGVYLPSANNVAISTNGTGRLFVDASGRVGIGTATAAARLHVEGTVDTSSSVIRITGTGACSTGISCNSTGTIIGTDAGGILFKTGVSANTPNTTGSERLRITSDGKLGLGTSSPSQKLHIGGSAPGDSIIRQDATVSGTNWEIGEREAGKYQWWEDDNDQVRMTLTSGGSLGIGTTSPNAKLNVSESTGASLFRLNGLNSYNLDITNNYDSGTRFDFNIGSGSGAFSFTTSAGERARIDSSGRLLVGISSSSSLAKLVVQGRTSGTNNPGHILLKSDNTPPSADRGLSLIEFADTNEYVGASISAAAEGAFTSSSHPSRLVFSTTADGSASPTERMRIDSSGRVGINTTTVQSLLHLTTPNFVDLRFTTTDETTDQKNWVFQTGTAIGAGTFRLRAINDANTDGQNAYILTKSGTSIQTHQWLTAGYERLRITSDGKVGIGTTSPGGTLHIKGGNADTLFLDNAGEQWTLVEYKNNGSLRAQSYYDETAHVFGHFLPTENSPSFIWKQGSSERARIDSSGRLLVGASTSIDNRVESAIQVVGGGADSCVSLTRYNNSADGSPILVIGRSKSATKGTNVIVADNDSLGRVNFTGADGSNFITAAEIAGEVDGTPGANDMPGRLVFRTTADGASSPTERMRIDSLGNCFVTYNILMDSSGSSGGRLYINGTSNNQSIATSSSGAGSTTLYIGNAAIQVSSDARLKENIEDTNLDALDAISKIKVKDFTWNDPTDTSYNNRNARGKWTGLIAQELVEVLPFVVNAPRKEEDGSIDHESEAHWTLDQSQLCPVLIKAIQQQQEIIAELEARLSALEA
jgi:hypothetical protein